MSFTAQRDELREDTATGSPLSERSSSPLPQDQCDEPDLPTLEDLWAVVKRCLKFKETAWSSERFPALSSPDDICPWHLRKYWLPYDGKKDAENLYAQFLELQDILETFITVNDAPDASRWHLRSKETRQQLHESIATGKIFQAIQLLSRSADFTYAFPIALVAGQMELAKLCLEKRAKVCPNAWDVPLATIIGSEAATKLMQAAAWLNDAHILANLIEQGGDIHGADKLGHSILIEAVRANSCNSVLLLLAYGASVKYQVASTEVTQNILLEAFETGNSQMFRLLIDYGFDLPVDELNRINGGDHHLNLALITTPRPAHQIGNPLWVRKSENPTAAERVLLHAVKLGHLPQCARILGKASAARERDIREMDINWMQDDTTALIEAVRLGHRNIIWLLVKRAVDVNTITWSKKTALRMATETENESIIRFLLFYGADLDVTVLMLRLVDYEPRLGGRIDRLKKCMEQLRGYFDRHIYLKETFLGLRHSFIAWHNHLISTSMQPRETDKPRELNMTRSRLFRAHSSRSERWAFALEQNPKRAWHVAVSTLRKLQIGTPPKDLNEILLLLIFLKSIEGFVDASGFIDEVTMGLHKGTMLQWQLLFDDQGDGEFMFRNAVRDIFDIALHAPSSTPTAKAQALSNCQNYVLNLVSGTERYFHLQDFAAWAQAFGNIMFEHPDVPLVGNLEAESDPMRALSVVDANPFVMRANLGFQQLHPAPPTLLNPEILLDDDFGFDVPDITDSQKTLVNDWPLLDQGSFNEEISQLSVPGSPPPIKLFDDDYDEPQKPRFKKTFCDDCQQEFGTTSNYGKHRRGPKHDNVRFECKFGCGKDYLRNDIKMRHEKSCKKRLGSPRMPKTVRNAG